MTSDQTSNSIPLSVVMPVYNEEESIRQAVQEIQQRVLRHVPGSNLIAVNDGSRDRSGEILDELARHDPAIIVLHKQNGGHGDALMAGMNRAGGEYLMLVDSDRQIPLDQFSEHWARRESGSFICGVRQSRQDPPHRLALTMLVRAFIFLMFARWLRDANVPYKILPGAFWKTARAKLDSKTLTPSLFLSILAALDKSMRIVEVPVTHLPRRSGKVSLVSWRLLKFCFTAGQQLMTLRGRTLFRRS